MPELKPIDMKIFQEQVKETLNTLFVKTAEPSLVKGLKKMSIADEQTILIVEKSTACVPFDHLYEENMNVKGQIYRQVQMEMHHNDRT